MNDAALSGRKFGMFTNFTQGVAIGLGY